MTHVKGTRRKFNVVGITKSSFNFPPPPNKTLLNLKVKFTSAILIPKQIKSQSMGKSSTAYIEKTYQDLSIYSNAYLANSHLSISPTLT